MHSVIRRATRCGVFGARLVIACAWLPLFLTTTSAYAADLANPGFETGAIGSPPPSWTVTAAADVVTVVGTEGPANFSVYGPPRNITVVPFAEAKALRLGAPRSDSQAQNKGTNTVTQTFTPAGSDLRIPLRLFSFERRGDDHVIVDVVDGKNHYAVSTTTGSAFKFPGLNETCSTTPCDLKIDDCSASGLFDSGWQVMVIHGLPTTRAVTLSVSLTTKPNTAHPSWLYVDGEARNHPPVAKITYTPGSKPGTVALEGDFVSFSCGSSTDPDNDPLTCTWHATGAGLDLSAVGPTAYFVFPDDGVINMQLTVDDGKLTSSTSTPVTITNGVPIVAALDPIEVPLNGRGSALCRFLDPGVEDTHSVLFSLPGVSAPVEVQEEHQPSLSSGFGRATFDVAGLAAGSYSGQCTVTDSGGAGTTKTFAINVLTPADVAAREVTDSDSSAGAPVLSAGRTILTALEGAADVDVWQIKTRTGNNVPVGAEINVTVDVPVDYDAILLSRNANASSTPFVNAPFVNAPFVNAPFVNVPFVNVPFVNAPFVNVPFVNVPFVNAPFVSAPFVNAPFVSAPLDTSPFVNANFAFDNFPLSQVGLAAPDGGQISGIDIGLGELGSYNLGALQTQALGVKALSAQLGTRQEHMLVRVGPGEDAIFLAIVSHSGIASPAAASISVELATPPSQRQLLGANCNGIPLVPSTLPATAATSSTAVLYDSGAPLTLIVTQRERFQATWKQSLADFSGWLTNMTPFFANVSVQARVISVPSTIYDAADADTCDVAKQNAVATQIRDIIRAELAARPSIRYVQIIGGPDIVPPYYSPDETTISYEGLYASELFMLPGKPLGVALAEGYNPTDAYYASLNPKPFRGRELYIEDLPIGRLGETPSEILDAASTFNSTNGSPITKALATGYDFFADGAAATAQVLGIGGIGASVTPLISDTWNAQDLRCSWLGTGTGCARSDVAALNAHMSYNALLSANGFTNHTLDTLASTETSSGLLAGRTTLSIGCHSGFNFPDAWAIPKLLAGLSFDPGRDWTQEPGTWVGPWTFGIGDDTVADRGTEGIMTLVTEEMAKGRTLGDALVRAKQRYASGLFEFGVYDEKSLIGLGLFGMPQASFGVAPTVAAASVAAAGSPAGTLDLQLFECNDGALPCTTPAPGAPFSYAIEQQTNPRGEWFTLNGDAQAVFGRPLLPSAKPIEARSVVSGQTQIHGVALRGAEYTDYLDVDPVFPTPRHDWTASVDEPQPCVETSSPTQLAVVSTLQVGTAPLETLIVHNGQFRCTAAGPPVTGEMRIFDQLTMQALHPMTAAMNADFEPPTVLRQDVTASTTTNDVTAVLDAVDTSSNATPASGLREIIGLVFNDTDGVPGGAGTVTSVSTGDLSSQTPPYRLVLPGARGKQLAFEYIDKAGNLLQKSLKGALITAVDVTILPTQISSSGATTLSVFIGGFEGLTGTTLEINFGDGSAPTVYDLSAVPLPPGVTVALQLPSGASGSCADAAVVCDAIVTVNKTYSSVPNGTPITVVATVRADGAIGTATRVLTSCGDPSGDASANADIVGCAFTSNGTRVQIDLYVRGTIASGIFYKVVVGGHILPYLNGKAWPDIDGFGDDVVFSVTKLGTNGLRFSFDAAPVLHWNGTTPFPFKERTVLSTFPWSTLDETATLTGYPLSGP